MAPSNPLVTLVIPAFNHEDFVVEAIESVLAQTYSPIELIVFNDGSTDGTDAAIRGIHGSGGGAFQYVSKDNEGLVPTLNRALSMARGKYFAQFGSDDVLLPDTVGRQVDRLEADPGLGLVCGDAFYLEGRTRTRRRMLGERGPRYFRAPDMYRELLLHNFIINLTVLYRCDLLREVGGFDQEIPFFEDWDAVLRVSERRRIGYIDAPLGYWRLHAANTHKRIHWMFAGIRATMDKHFRRGRLSHRRWFRRHVFCRIHYRYGKQLLEVGDPSGACASITKALRYNPFYLRAYSKFLRAAWDRSRRKGGTGPSATDAAGRLW